MRGLSRAGHRNDRRGVGAIGQGDGKIQSLVIGSLFVGLGYITFVIAFLSDAIATNRRISEECLERLRRMEADGARTR